MCNYQNNMTFLKTQNGNGEEGQYPHIIDALIFSTLKEARVIYLNVQSFTYLVS